MADSPWEATETSAYTSDSAETIEQFTNTWSHLISTPPLWKRSLIIPYYWWGTWALKKWTKSKSQLGSCKTSVKPRLFGSGTCAPITTVDHKKGWLARFTQWKSGDVLIALDLKVLSPLPQLDRHLDYCFGLANHGIVVLERDMLGSTPSQLNQGFHFVNAHLQRRWTGRGLQCLVSYSSPCHPCPPRAVEASAPQTTHWC